MQLDKFIHAVACYAIATVVGMTMTATMGTQFKLANAFVGFLAAMAIGICKEAYDLFSGKGVADKYDLLADGIGALIGATMIAVF